MPPPYLGGVRLRLIFLAALITAAPACAKASGTSARQEPSPSASTVPATASPTPTPAPVEPTLVFATKSGRVVTVKTLGLHSRVEETLFTYEERQPAEHSGNYWEEQPPSIALSPTGDLLGYGAADGLHIYDLGARTSTTVVERVAEGKDEDSPPTWSPALEGTYGLHNFAWSGNGRYLSFDQSHSEGNTIGFYDRDTNRTFAQQDMPFSYADPHLEPAAWAAEGASSVVSASGSKSGLILSGIDDPSAGKLIRVTHQHFGQAALSPDASRVAFLFNDDEDDWRPTGVGIVRRDGTGLKTIDNDGLKSSVMIDTDHQVWWTEGGLLYRWDGSGKTLAGRVDASYEWELVTVDTETVALAGRSEKAGRGLFLLLERGTGKVLAMHGARTDFVNYLGLI